MAPDRVNSVGPFEPAAGHGARAVEHRRLFTTSQRLGWHPFWRINLPAPYRPAGATMFRPLSQGVGRIGQRWAGPVTGFATKERQRNGRLLARWDTG